MKELITTILMTLGVIFLIIVLSALFLMVRKSMEEKFEDKMRNALSKITGNTWSPFDNPIESLEESFEEFKEGTSDEVSNLWIQIGNIRKENERQYKVLKEAIKKLESKEVE